MYSGPIIRNYVSAGYNSILFAIKDVPQTARNIFRRKNRPQSIRPSRSKHSTILRETITQSSRTGCILALDVSPCCKYHELKSGASWGEARCIMGYAPVHHGICAGASWDTRRGSCIILSVRSYRHCSHILATQKHLQGRSQPRTSMFHRPHQYWPQSLSISW